LKRTPNWIGEELKKRIGALIFRINPYYNRKEYRKGPENVGVVKKVTYR